MRARDASIPLANYNGTNVWYAPGAAINSTEAYHAATHLEEEAYLANRYMFIGLMIVMLAYVLAQMPFTFVRMKAYGFWHGIRLRDTATMPVTPKRLRHYAWPIPVRRIPLIDLPLTEFLVVVVIWAAGLGVAGWCQATFLTDASRSTLVVMSLAALTAGLGLKSGGIGTWVVHGYTAVNFLHRWTGRLVLLLSTLHVIAYLVVFYQAGKMRKPENYLGAMGYGGLLLTGLLSMGFVRRRWWLLFKFGHHIGILLLLAGLNYHSQDVVPYLLAIWALLVINTAFRSISTRLVSASLIALPGAASVLVTVPLTHGFTPGQHVRLRLLDRTLWQEGFESHPFTIASANGQNIQLIVKRAGDWTTTLYDLALQRRTIRCTVEGPYGGPINFIFPAFGSVCVVVGGSGISFGLGVVRGVLADVLAGVSACEHVTLVWTVKDQANIDDFADIISDVVACAAKVKKVRPIFSIQVHLHFTSKCHMEAEDKVEIVRSDLDGLKRPGRPDLAAILTDVLKTARGGVGVGACGPAALVDKVQRLVRAVPSGENKRVGGVELHAEQFSL